MKPVRVYSSACPHCAGRQVGECPTHEWQGRVNEDELYPSFHMVMPGRAVRIVRGEFKNNVGRVDELAAPAGHVRVRIARVLTVVVRQDEVEVDTGRQAHRRTDG